MIFEPAHDLGVHPRLLFELLMRISRLLLVGVRREKRERAPRVDARRAPCGSGTVSASVWYVAST